MFGLLAFQAVRDECFGGSGDRQEARNVAVIVTDGVPFPPHQYQPSIDLARELRARHGQFSLFTNAEQWIPWSPSCGHRNPEDSSSITSPVSCSSFRLILSQIYTHKTDSSSVVNKSFENVLAEQTDVGRNV